MDVYVCFQVTNLCKFQDLIHWLHLRDRWVWTLTILELRFRHRSTNHWGRYVILILRSIFKCESLGHSFLLTLARTLRLRRLRGLDVGVHAWTSRKLHECFAKDRGLVLFQIVWWCLKMDLNVQGSISKVYTSNSSVNNFSWQPNSTSWPTSTTTPYTTTLEHSHSPTP